MRTLFDVLLGAAADHPDQVIVHVRPDGTERTVTHRELLGEALRVAGGLAAAGITPGTPALLLADAGDTFQPLFWGAVAAGVVPVPLPDEPQRLAGVRRLLPDAVTLTAGDLERLREHRPADAPVEAGPDDVAMLQFSSGSTGDPRGVELTHANVLANLEQARVAGAAHPGDVLVTWMPYFHDMGLIGTHLTPLATGLKQVRIPPFAFAKRPAVWFETAARHRATLLSAANFALALTVRRVPEEVLAGLDLSQVRLLAVGAEPVAPAVWRAFQAHTRRSGLPPRAMQPVYGLAEATLAVTFPPLGELAVPVTVDRAALAAGRVVACPPGPGATEVMDVGFPVPGCRVRVTDERGRDAGDRRVGQIEVAGPNVARGYHRAPAATAETFRDGWLRTGDLGFLHDARLCVTGRAKDVVFVNGRTFHAPDLEQIAAATPGLPGGATAVVGSTGPSGTERVAVFVQWARPPAAAQPVLDDVRTRVAAALGHDDVRVLPVAARVFPRTTSGKVRRSRLRQRYDAGEFDPVPVPADVERVVRDVWGRVLGIAPHTIGADDPFFALGGSSLKAMEVLAGLEDAFGVELDPAELRDRATVAALTDFLLRRPRAVAPRAVTAAGQPDRTAAVIGMACRFPGAATPERFWELLAAGHDSVTRDESGRWGARLEEPFGFDNAYFGMTDDESTHTDPHARIFLELAHEALERAGYAGPRRRGRRVGVFAAVGESGFPELLHGRGDGGPLPPAALTGGLRNLLPARVAQALDLTGPALAVDTACSSALVAVHLAVRSLAAGECDIAVVGGVNLHLTPTVYRTLDAAGVLSPTGRCRAFDGAADGFVPGEGGAALVLARTADAVAAGDPIAAVVRGTAVNNDGRSLSLLAPNPLRQRDVIAQAYASAGVDPASVSYVEAHGTGTELGDPVELRSLAHVFTPPAGGGPRWLGSVKTNVGHLLNVAALPSLVKVILAVQHRQLPPSLHHTTPPARFDLAGAGFAVVTQLRDWVADGPLLAGVNAFGFGGTNAHAIIQEPPPVPDPGSGPVAGPHLLTLSATTPAAVRAAAAALAAHLRARPDLAEADVAAAAGTARDDGPFRFAAAADGDLARLLDAAEPVAARRPRLALLVPPGADAAVERLRGWGVVAGTVERCDAAGVGPAVRRLLAAGYDTFADLGVGAPVPAPSVLTLGDGPAALLALAGRIWELGGPLDRSTMDAGRRRVPVPTYPFERRPFPPPGTAAVLAVPAWVDEPAGAGQPPGPVRLTGPGVHGPLGGALRELVGDEDGGAVTAVYLAGPAADPPDGAALDAAVTATVTTFLAAVRDLPRRLLVVTEDVHGTGTAPERLRPVHAILTGLAAALADEHPGLAVRVVDLSSLDSPADRAQAVLRELSGWEPAGVVVAWRARRRLTRRLVPSPAGRDAGAVAGVQLVVGGTGGVGAAIARDLAARGAPRLIVTGRAARPPAGLLGTIGAIGAAVEYRRCDITVPADVDALIAGLPPITGVFHAAGIVRPGTLRSKPPAEILAVLAPKVQGVHLLAAALRRHGHDPATFTVVSSVSAVTPGLAGAVGDYAAANAFLDAFAAAETAAGRRMVSVALPPVAATGMTAAHAPRQVAALPAGDAVRALRAATALGVPHVVVDGTTPLPATHVPPAPAPPRPSAVDRTAGGPTAERIRRLLAEALHRDPKDIADDAPFLGLGLDSLTAVDLVKRLEAELGRDLPVTLFFEYTTVAELAAHLAGDAAPQGVFPLTPVQLAFHASERLHPGVTGHAFVRQSVTGPLDERILRAALEHLEARHPMLRMRIVTGGGRPGQIIGPPGTGWFRVSDVDAEKFRNEPIDLTREPPLRVVLARRTDERSDLLLVLHHAAGDGYSLNVLGEELWACYTAIAAGRAPDLPPLTTGFQAYAATLTGPAAADVAYWRATLAGLGRQPFDGEPAPPFAAHQVSLDATVTAALRARAAADGVSLFHLLLAAYARCLGRWSGQERVAVQVARAGRTARLPGIERVVGPFADTLPVVLDRHCDAGGARDAWVETERHASVSSLDIARLLRDTGGGLPGFSFARFAARPGATGPLNAEVTAAATASAATRLGLLGWESAGTLHFSWNHSTAVLSREVVAGFAEEHLAELRGIADVSILIRAVCRQRPDAVAVDDGTVRTTYAELDAAADRAAGLLRSRGVRRGDLVGLLTAPGAATVAGVLGILRTGAGWVPLDAEHPPARLRDQLTRSGATILLHDAGNPPVDGFPAADLAAAREVAVPADEPAAPQDVAYVIFTSGSTGRPKGVPVTHASMANYLLWAVRTFGYGPADRIAQTASPCFDASVRQILAPLLAGATVVLLPRQLLLDPDALLSRVESGRLTVWSSVPTLWELLLRAAEARPATPDLSALRLVHVGGEALPPAHVRRWFNLFGPGQRITNLYGPTETTVNATWHLVDRRPADDVTRIPIGRPVGGAVVEVVAADGRTCADGEPGELWVGGAGLTGGYLGEPDLTAAAFTQRHGRRYYRTGDRVVRTASGVLEFLGRLDDQVQLHGRRIEPGEIEAVLQDHPAVRRAAVVHRSEPHPRLEAYVEGTADPAELRRYLTQRLPRELVPARIHVGAVPLTPTGKVDRAPLTSDTVQRLARIWAELLDVAVVAPDDDFFALGGDSILALELFDRLRAAFPALPRPTVIHQHRTLAALAAAIDAAGPASAPPDASDGGGPFPVTATQRGFLLGEAIRPGGGSAWLARLRLRGPLRREDLQRAVDVLVERHPMLRTVFPAGARPPVQQELPASLRLPVDYERLASAGEVAERVAAQRAHRFEPWAWPLLRLRLLALAPDDHVLLVHAHHLIGDGYCAALLTRELLSVHTRLTAGEPAGLAPLRSTFRDYVRLLEHRPVATRAAEAYTPPVLDGGAGGTPPTAGFTVDAATSGRLRRLATGAGSTAFAPVLTAYHRALAHLTGQDDLVVGLAVTGRDHPLPDLHRVFGPCAAMLAVRLCGTGGFRSHLGRVVAAVDAARDQPSAATPGTLVPAGAQFFFSHLDFDALGPAEDTALRLEWDDGDTELEPPPIGTDVFATARPAGGGLRVTLRANPGALTPAALDGLAARFHHELRAAVSVPRPSTLDAAIVGYLPPLAQLAAHAGPLDREQVRATLFPDGTPRVLEELRTPLGRSGFVCLPLFADELAAAPLLPADVARAAGLAAGRGARCVSLAGMIPSLTGYGLAVRRHLGPDVAVTTGHAVTAVSVVLTVLAALAAAGRTLDGATVAVVGVGSIGRSSLELLLARSPWSPARLVLCDVAGGGPRLAEFAGRLGFPGPVDLCHSDRGAPDAVHAADVIIGAASGGHAILDADRLRPGTIVVDDSFPHCVDPERALARMRRAGDVVVAGGGLLDCGPATRTFPPDLPAAAVAARTGAAGVASCQLESLVRAADPRLPLVAGLVDGPATLAYWDAVQAAGVTAAPLHLLHHPISGLIR